MSHLFVYGTLRRASGHPMHRVLAEAADFVGEATAAGRMYWADGYPCVVPSESPADRVRGEVYRLADPEPTFAALDAYEQCDRSCPEQGLFRRRRVEVTVDDGRRLDAWIYLYNRSTEGLPRIASGDFLTG